MFCPPSSQVVTTSQSLCVLNTVQFLLSREFSRHPANWNMGGRHVRPNFLHCHARRSLSDARNRRKSCDQASGQNVHPCHPRKPLLLLPGTSALSGSSSGGERHVVQRECVSDCYDWWGVVGGEWLNRKGFQLEITTLKCECAYAQTSKPTCRVSGKLQDLG